MRPQRLAVLLAVPASFAIAYFVLSACSCPTPRTCSDQFCACLPVLAAVRPDENAAELARSMELPPEMCVVDEEIPF